MNLFWKRLFGKLQSTERYEEEKKRLLADFNRYASVRESELLKEYNALTERVKSADFQANKKSLTSRKYKDTEEYRDMHKFEKLSADTDIRRFYEIEKNGTLAEYLAFKQKPDFAKLSDAKAVKESPELTRLKNFEKSDDYKLYLRLNDSYVLKEYEELKKKVNTDDFKKRNDFWSNPKRYETTEEYRTEQRLAELAKNPDIIFFNKCNYKRFSFIDNFQEVFDDHFSYAKLRDGSWKPGFHYISDQLKSVHSFLNERQANAGGKNVQLNGALVINTKTEKTQAPAWHPSRGFVMKDYEFTSDVINGYDAIHTNKGLFRAKMRFTGSTGVCHAFWLVGDHKVPHINVIKNNGGSLEVGVYYNANGNVQYTHEVIKGINPANWYYYEVEWNDNALVWYINNLEVFRTSAVIPNEDLFPMFNSFIPDTMKGGEAAMEVDHVQVFKLK
ncbi:MAG: glycoside hydrolase family 16 protein [Paludibacteraceae bacterium]|nr:glycoside hydrolase family 16 protein [Paludibacteraceae bacterium]